MSPNELEKNHTLALESALGLLDQCTQAWQESKEINFPENYKKVKNIVVCGMGGSSMPAYIMNAVFPIKVPLYVCQNYILPAWVGSDTLVVLSSYSGNTEETLSCANEAKRRGSLVTGITSGGKLSGVMEDLKLPYYLFDPKHNPSRMPRFGVCYGVFGLLGLLRSLDLVSNPTQEQSLDTLISSSLDYAAGTASDTMKMAEEFVETANVDSYMVVSSEHLKGNGLLFASQFSETSKRLSFSVEIPEINHNLVEGLTRLQGSMTAVFLKSQSYHPRNIYRYDITREILQKSGHQMWMFEVSQGSLVQEMLEVLVFSSHCSIGLARKNGIDPLSIPTIDFIKGKLLT